MTVGSYQILQQKRSSWVIVPKNERGPPAGGQREGRTDQLLFSIWDGRVQSYVRRVQYRNLYELLARPQPRDMTKKPTMVASVMAFAALNAAALSHRFPSLAAPLQSSTPLLGLYFASSWCSDCTAVTPSVDAFAAASKDSVQVIYVSSDASETQMKQTVPSSFGFVPFDCVEERDNLKRHFGVCAAKEREALGLSPEERKFGIPTLIVLERATGKVLTTEGVEDIVNSNGESAVKKWKAMV